MLPCPCGHTEVWAPSEAGHVGETGACLHCGTWALCCEHSGCCLACEHPHFPPGSTHDGKPETTWRVS